MKRLVFMGGLLVLFIFCYSVMNEHYDELARYQYVNDDNRKIITEHLSAEEITVLIDRQYQPEEFLPFIDLEGFNIRYVQWYNDALIFKKMDHQAVIDLVNLAVNHDVRYSSFLSYVENYDIDVFEAYLNNDSIYLKDFTLILKPAQLGVKIDKDETLYRYQPQSLVEVIDLPMVSESGTSDRIRLTEETNEAIHQVCEAMKEASGKTCGNMIITKGFVSFDEQVKQYEAMLLKVGSDAALLQVDYPGQSYYQLGTQVKLVPAQEDIAKDQKNETKSAQQLWLEEHVAEFGFEFVNASQSSLTEFELRYVGKAPTVTIDERNEVQ